MQPLRIGAGWVRAVHDRPRALPSLVQGCRHVEIDCWDAPKGPKVTHGHTFCTVEQFDEVAKAVAECAFVTSELPVILSLEMHCTPAQQHRIATTLIEQLGGALLTVRLLEPKRSLRLLEPKRSVQLPSVKRTIFWLRPTALSPLHRTRNPV